MAGRYGDIDYAKLTKTSVLLGVSLVMGGFLGDVALGVSTVHAPGWIDTVLVDAEFLGILVVLLAVFIFGILLPLTE
ncbi:hypothetical protein GCM10008995_19830 [Halobellus salinus]|uniref:Uncharacterized protein n=1 Tax=Halobellus salinus TaxID=931585 RepID=A0A830ERG5_9EURY|nr:hypothetical protein [Halobellus salinus]GGJ09929.1 hypothetical protein GCM10008995_19830 [Halobellus salinus]SMP24792.1 hypothetical protein SAMN06265347_11055 [Halobellus salinus]